MSLLGNLQSSDTYRICNRCVMDTSDSDIVFDDDGNCNHCKDYLKEYSRHGYYPEISEKKLRKTIDNIKANSKRKKYDCVVGISGGVDSCYIAHLCKEYGLRPLLVHMDNGWDTELAVANIKTMANALGFDYISYVLNWEDFKEIEIAFLKSSSVDLELPTDVAILRALYDTARKYSIKYIISGSNLSSEGILPLTWGYHVLKDQKYYRGIVKKFARKPIKTIPDIGLFEEAYYKVVLQKKFFYILNYINYDSSVVKQFLINKYNWRDYGSKHHESKITAFWQSYVMYYKYNMDYRRAHLSPQICLGKISRDEALALLKEKPYDEQKIHLDKAYISKKLDISIEELEEYLSNPPKIYKDFENRKKFIQLCYRMYSRLFQRNNL